MVTYKQSIVLIALSSYLTLLSLFLTITLPGQGAADISSLKSCRFHLGNLQVDSFFSWSECEWTNQCEEKQAVPTIRL